MTFNQMRYEFGQCHDCSHKQIGLRAIRNAKALGDRNPARVAELRAIASFHLPLAQAFKPLTVPYVETDIETAYGSTVRLSRSVRVF